MPGLLYVAIFAAIALFALASHRVAHAVGVGTVRPRATLASSMVLVACATMPFYLGTVPITGLYIGVWLATLATFGAVGGTSVRSFLVANTGALCFMLACSLLRFGYLCIFGYAGSDGMPSELRGALLCGSFVLSALYLLALARILKDAYPSTKGANRALTSFFAFGFFGICYELLDIAPPLEGLWFPLMPYILLGGTLLLTIVFGTFAFVAARLGVEAFHLSESIALERKRKDQEARLRLYRTQASVDQLTMLATRRAGQEQLDRLEREDRAFTVAFVDVDGLKQINDEKGHLSGDDYLAACATTLREAFPSSFAVRWGGDEFLVIDEELTAAQMEARLAKAEASAAVLDQDLRFSFGVVAASPGAASDVVRLADEAMYAAKRGKRAAAAAKGGDGR